MKQRPCVLRAWEPIWVHPVLWVPCRVVVIAPHCRSSLMSPEQQLRSTCASRLCNLELAPEVLEVKELTQLGPGGFPDG